MPLQICPKCSRFHYVPGACPEPRVPIATPITSPKGVNVVAHGDTPMQPETREALGKLVDATVEKMASKKRGRPATGFDKKAHDRQKAKERRAAAKGKK